MAEKLQEYQEITKVPEAPKDASLNAAREGIESQIESIGIGNVQESSQGKVGEQWTGNTGQGTGGTTPVQNAKPLLPDTVPEMRKLVRTQIKSEIQGLWKEVKKTSQGKKYSAYEVNHLVMRIRQLKSMLSRIMEYGMEKLKEILFSIVPASHYTEKNKDL
jgi:hypothetical protein